MENRSKKAKNINKKGNYELPKIPEGTLRSSIKENANSSSVSDLKIK